MLFILSCDMYLCYFKCLYDLCLTPLIFCNEILIYGLWLVDLLSFMIIPKYSLYCSFDVAIELVDSGSFSSVDI